MESTTDELLEKERKTILEIDSMGGAMECVKAGMQQRIIHESAWEQLSRVENGDELVVGVNSHVDEMLPDFEGMVIKPEDEMEKLSGLKSIRESRDDKKVHEELEDLRESCRNCSNVMEPIISAVKAEATLGEVNKVMREEFGTWVSPSGV